VSRDAVYLRHILDAIEKIERYAAVGQGHFFAEPHWQDAIIRQLAIIGEATKRLSPELRDRHPEVAWRRMSGLSDVLVHDYMGIELGSYGQSRRRRFLTLSATSPRSSTK
jgi:uncharacterized protein with HEPN domain